MVSSFSLPWFSALVHFLSFASVYDRKWMFLRKGTLLYPISTLHEHLHSTSLSYAETTLNSRKLVSFPLIAHYLSAGPPLPPTPPFTGRPGHTHTYPSFLTSAPRKQDVLLAAVTRYVCFALKALKLPVFSFELTLLTFSVSYLWIISYIYIYIYIRSAFYVFLWERGGGQWTSVLCSPSSWTLFVFSVMTSISSVETPVDRRRFVFSSVFVAY